MISVLTIGSLYLSSQHPINRETMYSNVLAVWQLQKKCIPIFTAGFFWQRHRHSPMGPSAVGMTNNVVTLPWRKMVQCVTSKTTKLPPTRKKWPPTKKSLMLGQSFFLFFIGCWGRVFSSYFFGCWLGESSHRLITLVACEPPSLPASLQTVLSEPAWPDIVHCCTLSLCYLAAETGWSSQRSSSWATNLAR